MSTTRVDETYSDKVKSINDLNVQSSFDLDVEKCGVGGRIWKSAIAFADMVKRYDMSFRDKTIIEIGAGTGLCGLAAALSSPSKVVITDIDPGCLKTIQLNVDLNETKIEKSNIVVEKLNFGNDKNLDEIVAANPEGFDYVIGTDIVYGQDLIPLLIKGLNKLSFKEGCQIILVLNTIFPEVEMFFDELKKTERYSVRTFEAVEMDDMYYKINVFFIKVKKGVK